ncbi:hypothetical protein FJTKL_12912 [Diaporthe vaccinii]|uniref:Uncharacterized protein n=1 Tax=Diaporthe vaccinii TaxID=105482 RepID=A0ABR4FA02_9PEZI
MARGLEQNDTTRQTWTLVDQIARLLALNNCINICISVRLFAILCVYFYNCSLAPAKSRVLRTTTLHF